jgi:anti-sigma factor (TIGR02949 family)
MDTKRTHEHKNCRKLLGSLSDYVDGELDEELCSVLEQHLDGCEDCRIVVDTLRKTVYLYHESSKAEDIPSEVRERLYKSLKIEDYFKK